MKKCVCLVLLGATLGFHSATAAPIPLVNRSDLWTYHKGTNPPQSDWKTAPDAALDGTWATGNGGFGYATDNTTETNNCRTSLSGMRNTYTTLYIRKTFEITNTLATNLNLLLRMDWDDGYLAWLDGAHLTNANMGGTTTEPAYTATASSNHESSLGNSSPQPAVTNNLGPASARLPVGTHTLAIMGLNRPIDSSDFILVADLWLDVVTNAPPVTNGVSGTISANTTWYATNSPYRVIGNVSVAAGVTLTIEPGVEVLFSPSVGLSVSGRLLAEGTPASRIRFARAGGSAWTRLSFTGATESRIAYADIDGAGTAGNVYGSGTSLYLDHIVWTNTTVSVLDLHTSSIVLQHSVIPGIGSSEPIHFSTMPANGRALIKGNFFGAPQGYNDVIDFTGGNRPGPIVEFIDNVFVAAVDDVFDMDGTDAHIEGNIFLNVHQDATRASTANPIATGAAGSDTSELVIVRNILFDCDHALLLKDRGSAIFDNNTVVTIRTNQYSAAAAAFINFSEPHRGTAGGRGVLMDGNILWDLRSATPFLNFTNGTMFLTLNRSILGGTNHPGTGNSTNDPMFVNLAGPMTAQNVRSNLALRPGSPALGTGPNGLDMGALVPAGASISGVPASPTAETNVTLRVAGPGVVAFKWKLNDGPWSAEVPLTNSFLISTTYFNLTNGLISLTGLTNGSYTFQAIGKNSAGIWQPTNEAASVTWTVQTGPRDSDGDGMTDDWEDANGFLANDPSDAALDADDDGLTNLEEFLAGTEPRNPQSFLKVDAEPAGGAGIRLLFTAISNRTYTIQSRDAVAVGSWSNRVHFDSAPTNRVEQWTDEEATNRLERYYRLQTPATP